jgi:hypothetical protein
MMLLVLLLLWSNIWQKQLKRGKIYLAHNFTVSSPLWDVGQGGAAHIMVDKKAEWSSNRKDQDEI